MPCCILRGRPLLPESLPFPLLHVDTTWKFREMIKFRDEAARFAGMVLLVDVNQEGVRRGISPVHSGSSVHTQVMKAEALRQALDKWKVALAIGGARHTPGIHATSAPNYGGCSIPASRLESRCAFFRCPIGPNLTSGTISSRKHPGRTSVFRQAASGRAERHAEHGSMTRACRCS